MYPPYVTNGPVTSSSNDPAYIVVECCNKIFECIANGFTVYVDDEDPVLDTTTFTDTFII